jgi:spermidine synthase
MNPEGIIVLILPGSLTYVSLELRDLNGSVLDTLRNVFRSVRIIPGDGVNLYLASNYSGLEKTTPEELVKRFEEMKIRTSLFTKSYLEFRLHERWVKWFLESLNGRKVNINSDFRPISVFLSLSYWNALFSPYLTATFQWFEGFSLQIFIAFMFLLTLLIAILFIKKPHLSRQSLPYSIFTTGLAGMIFNLAIIFTFQTLYGYLYHQIGLLIAIFMFGVALSSFYMTRRLDRIGRDSSLFLKIEVVIVLFSFLFPFIFIIPSQYLDKTAVSHLVYVVFLIMSFLSGSWIGLQFPLATKIYLNRPSRGVTLGYAAGLLYGADLLGGFLGGLFGGIFLLPILGLKESCFLMGLIKASSMALFLIFMKTNKARYDGQG